MTFSTAFLQPLIYNLSHQNLRMKIIFSCFFLWITNLSHAAIARPPLAKDTVIKKEYGHNEKEFLENYGRDDSSRALIKLYFRKRRYQNRSLITGAVLFTLGLIASFPLANLPDKDYQANGWFEITTASFFAILAASMATAGVPMMLTGGSLLAVTSRRKLLRWLNDYFDGKYMPKRVVKSMPFKAYMEYGEWNSKIRKQMKRGAHERVKAKRAGDGLIRMKE